jgi:uncharacterized membrane protein
MRHAGRWIMLIPALIALLFMGREAYLAYYLRGSFSIGSGLLALIALVIPGAVLWLAGWIVEGFAKDTD